jgi:Cft2 family RNA processing exonuclease
MIKLSYGGTAILFDSAFPGSKRGMRCVSHAHSDHVSGGGLVVSTAGTAALMRGVWDMEARFKTLEYGEPLKHRGLKITPHNAGHVLGSSMFHVEADGLDLLYTGDINTAETLTTKPAEPVEAEVLVIECTYGHPDFIFPSRSRVYAEILRWATSTVSSGAIPAFKAYSIGKSQELVKLFNTYTTLPVVTGPVVSKASKTYVEQGEKLEFHTTRSAEGRRLLATGKCVYIDSQVRTVPTHRRVKWAVATGWSLKYGYRGFDAAFPLSGHADFKQLLSFVEEVGPKKVFAVHGYSRVFTSFLRRRGFDARPLEDVAVQDLLQGTF